MQATTKYRSLFTGKQIDETLQSVRDKIDKSSITNDYSGGEADKVVSAAAVKSLSDAFDKTFTAAGIRALVDEADDSNVFTDADKRKVNGINVQFKGTVADIASRDAIDTAQYLGGEVILVLRNTADVSEFQYWDGATEVWEAVTSGGGEKDRATLPTGTTVIASYSMNEISGAKYLVHGKSTAGDSHVAEVMVTNKLTAISWSVYGEVTAGDDVFTLSLALSGNGIDVELSVTTTQPSSVISVVKQADF
uniref:Structural protein n=1 Tax=Pseudomonas phage Cygsa01 TaxID=3138529 RepID=A0AAU6W3S5_9VIRU